MFDPRRFMRCTILLAVACCAFEASAPAAEPFRLRVLSYNIHHGEGIDGVLDLKRIAKVIESVEPDLVALQEVDRNTRRTEKVDQPERLAELTGLKVVFERNIEFEGGQYGNAVLSRLPIERHENHHLPRFDEGEQRGVLEVEIDLGKQRGSLLLFATHLDHRRDQRERIASAKAIEKLMSDRADRPAILAGDLNAVPDSEPLKIFGRTWTRANRKPRPTVPVDEPSRQIDYVLYRPAERWKAVEVRVLDEAVASDHRAIFAVLELRPADEVPSR